MNASEYKKRVESWFEENFVGDEFGKQVFEGEDRMGKFHLTTSNKRLLNELNGCFDYSQIVRRDGDLGVLVSQYNYWRNLAEKYEEEGEGSMTEGEVVMKDLEYSNGYLNAVFRFDDDYGAMDVHSGPGFRSYILGQRTLQVNKDDLKSFYRFLGLRNPGDVDVGYSAKVLAKMLSWGDDSTREAVDGGVGGDGWCPEEYEVGVV